MSARLFVLIGGFRGGGRAPLFSCIFKLILKHQRYFIAACPEKWSFHSGGRGGGGWGSRPPLSDFSESPLPRMLSCWLNGALFRGNWLSEQFIYYEKYYFNVFLVPWEINKRFRSKTRDRCFNMADFHFQRHRHLECFIRNLISSMSLIRCDKIKSVMLF